MPGKLDVLTLGETMVLFHPLSSDPLQHASLFHKSIAGAETNVAIGLARLGHQAGWISRLGDDGFGRYIHNAVRGEGVDTSFVRFDPAYPTGVLFKEHRPNQESRVYYYRHQSAASTLSPTDLSEDWFAGVRYLHVTGITPALSDSCCDTVYKAIDLARRHGVEVIFDPNIRFKLWRDRERAKNVLIDIARQADYVLPGISEGAFLVNHEQPHKIADALLELGAKCIVVKLGEAGAWYQTATEQGSVAAAPVAKIVDPVGAGDAFAAGFISGLLRGFGLPKAVELAAQLAARTLAVQGDIEGLPYESELGLFGGPAEIER